MFDNKIILAPMVRFGTLPSRICALNFGADLVFAEEIVDKHILKSQLLVNKRLNTIDFIHRDCGGSTNIENYLDEDDLVFRTDPLIESDKLIFQIGTRDLSDAISVINMLTNFKWKNYITCKIFIFNLKANENSNEYVISGFDLNMGCPKDFSLKSGIGSALIKSKEEIELASNILEGMVFINKPLGLSTSCKIRVFSSLPETLELCQKLARTGINAITIHGRTPNEKRSSQFPNKNNYIHEISRFLRGTNCSVIANGDSDNIKTHLDILNFKKNTDCTSVMLARCAMKNLSIFSNHMVDRNEVIRNYLKLAIQYENGFLNTKYCIQQMFHHEGKSEIFKKLLSTKDYNDIFSIWPYCWNYYEELNKDHHLNGICIAPKNGQLHIYDKVLNKDFKNIDSIKHLDCHYDAQIWLKTTFNAFGIQKKYKNPKIALFEICKNLSIMQPSYICFRSKDNKTFKGMVSIENRKFSTFKWERNRKIAEQSAALCAFIFYAINKNFES